MGVGNATELPLGMLPCGSVAVHSLVFNVAVLHCPCLPL